MTTDDINYEPKDLVEIASPNKKETTVYTGFIIRKADHKDKMNYLLEVEKQLDPVEKVDQYSRNTFLEDTESYYLVLVDEELCILHKEFIRKKITLSL